MKRMLSILPAVLVLVAMRSCIPASGSKIPPPPENSTTIPMQLPLPIKAAQAANLSSSASATVSQAMPALSNDNAVERLQAVRKAQDKWGKRKVAPDIDRSAILGRWNASFSDAVYKILYADGAFKNCDGLLETEGTYRLLSNHEIEFTTPGFLYGKNVLQVEYRLLGDTLEFKPLGIWFTYKRATP
jgi:hypothetical protein